MAYMLDCVFATSPWSSEILSATFLANGFWPLPDHLQWWRGNPFHFKHWCLLESSSLQMCLLELLSLIPFLPTKAESFSHQLSKSPHPGMLRTVCYLRGVNDSLPFLSEKCPDMENALQDYPTIVPLLFRLVCIFSISPEKTWFTDLYPVSILFFGLVPVLLFPNKIWCSELNTDFQKWLNHSRRW